MASIGGTSRAPKMKTRKGTTKAVFGRDNAQTLLRRVGDYVVPIGSILVFFILVAFVYYPKALQILDLTSEIREIKSKQGQLEKKKNQLSALNVSKLEADLANADIVIPDMMDVSELGAFLEFVGRSDGLTLSSVKIEESLQASPGVQKDLSINNSDFRTVSGPFAFKGSLEDIKSFLVSLRQDKHLILFNKISVNGGGKIGDTASYDQGSWFVNFSALAYTMKPVEKLSLYSPVPKVDQELLGEIEARVERSKKRKSSQKVAGPTKTVESNSTSSSTSSRSSGFSETNASSSAAAGGESSSSSSESSVF